jgi:hypothetical protein
VDDSTLAVEGRTLDLVDLENEVHRLARGLGSGRLRLALGAAEHLALRQARSKPVMEEFKTWLKAEQPRHLTGRWARRSGTH